MKDSARLVWRPANLKDSELDDVLFVVLGKISRRPIEIHFNRGDLPMLEGMRAAGLDAIDPVICAIEKWDSIDIVEE